MVKGQLHRTLLFDFFSTNLYISCQKTPMVLKDVPSSSAVRCFLLKLVVELVICSISQQ